MPYHASIILFNHVWVQHLIPWDSKKGPNPHTRDYLQNIYWQGSVHCQEQNNRLHPNLVTPYRSVQSGQVRAQLEEIRRQWQEEFRGLQRVPFRVLPEGDAAAINSEGRGYEAITRVGFDGWLGHDAVVAGINLRRPNAQFQMIEPSVWTAYLRGAPPPRLNRPSNGRLAIHILMPVNISGIHWILVDVDTMEHRVSVVLYLDDLPHRRAPY